MVWGNEVLRFGRDLTASWRGSLAWPAPGRRTLCLALSPQCVPPLPLPALKFKDFLKQCIPLVGPVHLPQILQVVVPERSKPLWNQAGGETRWNFSLSQQISSAGHLGGEAVE